MTQKVKYERNETAMKQNNSAMEVAIIKYWVL